MDRHDEFAAPRGRLRKSLWWDIICSTAAGCFYSLCVGLTKWAAWGAIAASVLLGLAGQFVASWKNVSPAWFTLLSAITAATTYLFRATTWRDRAQAWFDHRRRVLNLASRLQYQQLAAGDPAQAIAAIAKEWNQSRETRSDLLKSAVHTEDAAFKRSLPETKRARKTPAGKQRPPTR